MVKDSDTYKVDVRIYRGSHNHIRTHISKIVLELMDLVATNSYFTAHDII